MMAQGDPAQPRGSLASRAPGDATSTASITPAKQTRRHQAGCANHGLQVDVGTSIAEWPLLRAGMRAGQGRRCALVALSTWA